MNLIDIETWNRKEHYSFFSSMASPFLGLTANVKCTNACRVAKENNLSLFAYYWHKSMVAVNSIKEFKYRIIDDKVYELDTINAGTTIIRQDHTFAFIYVQYDADFNLFNERLQAEIAEVRNSTGLRLDKENDEVDLIRHTTIPWVSFTSILHPKHHDNKDSIPRISFGKIFELNGEKYLPVSVEAHHGLLDGYHIGNYFELFERLLCEDTYK